MKKIIITLAIGVGALLLTGCSSTSDYSSLSHSKRFYGDWQPYMGSYGHHYYHNYRKY
jgi:hypothetical protein